jgi:Ca2+-transporting ATPase
VVNGSPTENALVHNALSAGVNVIELRRRFPLLKLIDRSESRNFMITYHLNPRCPGRVVAIKGSPTEVLSICRWYLKNGEKFPLTDEMRSAIENDNERMAQEALRILGVAYIPVSQSNGTGFRGEADAEFRDALIWLGLVGMADPIREGVAEFVAALHQAGIDTVMITGDQSPVAYAIAKELNLSRNDHLEILDSSNLIDINEDVMKTFSQHVDAFARVSPSHKLQIVQAFQRAGKVVAMTGDGINDGPALKAADLGIAMGHTGTDVAREVADVVLEDDRLETMVIAISQGRTIYNNIRKSLHFIISTNLSELMVMGTAMAAGAGVPLNTMQLLWINLVTDIFPGLALALEMPEPDVLNRPPRDPDEPIITKTDLKRMSFESAVISSGVLGAYAYGVMRYGMGPRASTLSFMTISLAELVHALSCRSETHSMFSPGRLPPNRYLDAALGGTLFLQALTMAVPGLRRLLRMVPLSLPDYGVAVGCTLLPLIVNEMTKGAAALTAQLQPSTQGSALLHPPEAVPHQASEGATA